MAVAVTIGNAAAQQKVDLALALAVAVSTSATVPLGARGIHCLAERLGPERGSSLVMAVIALVLVATGVYMVTKQLS